MNFIRNATRVARPAFRAQARNFSAEGKTIVENDQAQREIGIGLVLGLVGGIAWMGYAKSERNAVVNYYAALEKKNGN
jgi:hypothetical protein